MEAKALYPKSLRKFYRSDFEALKKIPLLSAGDLEKMGSRSEIATHGSVDIVISTQGGPWTVQKGVTIPGSCVVQIYHPTGLMYVGYAGWPYPVDATGRMQDPAGTIQQATGDFLVPGWNKFCLLARTPAVLFYNPKIPNWGASISDTGTLPSAGNYWLVGANDGGPLEIAFNDNYYPDNHGDLNAIIRITQASVFAKAHENLICD